MNYLDFELDIGPGEGREYPLAVVRSPAGEARETLHFPFGELELQNRLKDLEIALLRSGGKRRKVLSRREQAVQDFGRALFDALIGGEVRSRYDVSQREAARQGKGLRLKLRIQPPELAALPWEFLYDGRRDEYVCLSRSTPVVRYLEMPQAIQPLAVAPPLRILGAVVSPNDLDELDVEREKQRVEEAVDGLCCDGLVELVWLEGQTWRDLQRAMRRGPWHAFHFVGHGGFDRNADEGLIALADERGRAHLLRATSLGVLLADHQSLRMAVLNSCEGAQGSDLDVFSSTAAVLVRRGIPAVLAMQYEITDRAAIEFARAFYEALADGMPVDAAVAEARKAVSIAVANTVEWGTPVLYMRSPDGVLFDLKEQRKTARRALPRQTEPGREQERQGQRDAVQLPLRPAKRATTSPLRPFEPEMVLILAGRFLMGSDPRRDGDAESNEQPQHSPYLPDYYVAKTPVTNTQYAAFVQSTGHHQPYHWKGSAPPPDKGDHPVVLVSWHDAVAYCVWLSRTTGRPYRLPSEAEWEKAARGTDGRLWPWGNGWDEWLCNSRESGRMDTSPVGAYPSGASPYGLLDMSGDVWEWTADWYKPYPSSNCRDEFFGEKLRVLRGGSFGSLRNGVRCACRSRYYLDVEWLNLGFRVCASPGHFTFAP